MDFVTMPTHQTCGLSSRLSSLIHSHAPRPQRLSRDRTIPNPRRSPVSPTKIQPVSQTPPPVDLRARAISTLHTLRNTRDASRASEYLGSDVTVHHDDASVTTSREDFLSAYYNNAGTAMPAGSYVDVIEAVVDDAQRKVWLRSEVCGLPSGARKQSVDMMSFDCEGLMIACAGSQMG